MAASVQSTERWRSLCSDIKERVPESVGKDAWYLLIAAILGSSPDTTLFAQFYTYLVTYESPFNTSAEARTALSLRLRDTLFKIANVTGAPRVLSVLIPFASAESANRDPPTTTAADASDSKLSRKWELDNFDIAAIGRRGEVTITSIYGPLIPEIFKMFGSHSEDFKFYETTLIYGVYLSDFSVLSATETEVVMYTSIMCTGLRGPSLWHTRGLARILGARGTGDDSTASMGAVNDAVRAVRDAAKAVVDFVGSDIFAILCRVQHWPDPDDVRRDLGGWGDDEYRRPDPQ